MPSHTPEFIAEMKSQLEAEKSALERELESLGTKRAGDHQSDFPQYGRNEEDNATEVADYQARYSTTETLEERLKEVTAALGRITDGTYGQTSDADLIPEDRLRANPAATTLVQPSGN